MGVKFRYITDREYSLAEWSSDGFHQFRKRLAEQIGIDLERMKGYFGNRLWCTVGDAIVPLLNHSQYDGELTSEECAVVAPRLRGLVSNWPDDDPDKIAALHLADSMDYCVQQCVSLEFC